jgi:phosphoribosylglycinamide formyltransferase-1
VTARIAVLVSGTGTLLQALLDAAADSRYPARPVLVASDTAAAAGLARARAADVQTVVVDPADHADRAAWDVALTSAVVDHAPDWVVCAGFMRILGPQFLTAFDGRIVNSHPALLPAFPGAHGVRDALAYGVKVTGCTVHLVDGGVDTGPVIAQRPVDVTDEDDQDSLHERIKVVERELLVHVVARLAVHGCSVSGRKVTIP